MDVTQSDSIITLDGSLDPLRDRFNDNKEKIRYGIDLINKQNADTILFTGDMVNNKAEELYPWKDVIGKLAEKIKGIHPDLVEPALLRLD